MNTQKLKELFVEWQSAKVDSHYPTITFEESDMLEASFSVLTVRLEAAEQRVAELENDESRQRLANAEHQLYMKDLAINNIKASRRAQFEKRQEAERERDELRKTLQATQGGAAEAIKNVMRLQEEISRLDKESQRLSDQLGSCDRERLDWLKRAEKVEAELARRDAAAGEPTGVVTGYAVNGCVVSGNKLSIGDQVYTAAMPSVLPPAIGTREAIQRLEQEDTPGSVNVAYKWGYNQCRADAMALGTQQQKVVQLPAASVPHGWKLVPLKAFPSQWAAGQKAFDAAGISKIDPVYHAMVEAAPAQGGDL
jgi:chromosome segregation ATPase